MLAETTSVNPQNCNLTACRVAVRSNGVCALEVFFSCVTKSLILLPGSKYQIHHFPTLAVSQVSPLCVAPSPQVSRSVTCGIIFDPHASSTRLNSPPHPGEGSPGGKLLSRLHFTPFLLSWSGLPAWVTLISLSQSPFRKSPCREWGLRDDSVRPTPRPAKCFKTKVQFFFLYLSFELC